MIEDILKKRQQTKGYHPTKIPNRKVAEYIINKAYDLTASKQNLMPFKIHILGPHQKQFKKDFFDIVQHQTGGALNMNVSQAPYCLIFTNRLIKNPNTTILRRIKKGHIYNNCDPKKYKNEISGVSIEIGMYAKVLTSLALEKDIDVSYTLCFPPFKNNEKLWSKLSFLDEPPLFSMQIGYRYSNHSFNLVKENKPERNEVINWI
jgi:hypothetical protein